MSNKNRSRRSLRPVSDDERLHLGHWLRGAVCSLFAISCDIVDGLLDEPAAYRARAEALREAARAFDALADRLDRGHLAAVPEPEHKS